MTEKKEEEDDFGKDSDIFISDILLTIPGLSKVLETKIQEITNPIDKFCRLHKTYNLALTLCARRGLSKVGGAI